MDGHALLMLHKSILNSMNNKREIGNAPIPQFLGFLDGLNKESEPENNNVSKMSHGARSSIRVMSIS